MTRNIAEPLQRGDVMFYYDPIFIAGSQQGYRTRTILEIDTTGDLFCYWIMAMHSDTNKMH